MMLRGFIDESYSSENPPKMFALTCTIANGSEWQWIEFAWLKCLEEKNASLVAQGRKPIRRYHSVSINNFVDDFEDWNGDERTEFCKSLLKIFERHDWGYEGYLINLQELVDEWPETADDPLESAYDICVRFIMLEIGRQMKVELPEESITLFFERCNYNKAIRDAFDSMIEDPTFAYKNCFTTIAPQGWEKCIPLQPADLVAYENFKEGYRELPPRPGERQRDQRLIFTHLISIESFVPHLKKMTRENIRELRDIVNRAKLKKKHGS